ncbi:Protein of unknown function, DUF255 [Mucilaginibacter pineti]|uniref:Thioredoxin domain-containing protein n=1 Tax=Mucilaginibacter pineti TaxID=1391627 RepID=A0A1G7IHL5_9SPHI|nr:DUF255 domain-containing protein [Mucilaginibacter pineti]SDF12078.1 Protein of unknown function, DUF255 [Mucilaginibacter pineti]
MKRLMTFLALSMMVLTSDAQGLSFSKAENWAAVLEQARVENKYIFLDGAATWCKPCKMMDEKVYPSKAVGKLMNDKFIAVKVQIDKADGDDAYVKSWYGDAEMLKGKYQLTTLPALVFLSPDGELLYRNFGYQDPQKFIETVRFAVSPEASTFKRQLETYKKGVRDYPALPKLIGKMRELLVEDSLANEMVRDYFGNYVDKLTDQKQILTKENAQLADANPGMVKSTDKFFVELKKTPLEESDKLIEWLGGSLALLETMAKKEELYLKLFKNGKMVTAHPDWVKIEKSIHTKYPQLDAGKIIGEFGAYGHPFLNEGFYLKTGDWKRFNAYYQTDVEDKLKRSDWTGINNICWWYYFVPVADKMPLEKALTWASLNVEKAKADPKVSAGDLSGWMDTKAALLYKLGRRREAVTVEQNAVAMLKADNLKNGREADAGCGGLLNSIELMKKGEKIQGGFGVEAVYPANWKLID